MESTKKQKRIRRHVKIRMTLQGTNDRPRLYVFRSNAHIYAQLVDDGAAKVIASVSDLDMKGKKGTKSEVAKQIGTKIAQMAKEKKITAVVFDRGGFLFHGRIKAVADGAREGGLTF